MSFRCLRLCCCILSLIVVFPAIAQDPGDARPVVGLRENPPDLVFLSNARVVAEPGRILDSASISIRGTSIVAVGKNIQPPAGAEIIDCSGKTIYAGLIDAFGEIEVPEPPTTDAEHWNGYVLPRRAAADAIKSVDNVASLRAQGVTMRLIAPRGGIVKGTSCLVTLSGNSTAKLFAEDVAQHLQLTVPRDKRRDAYPNSPMGAVALLRQTMSDADWYTRVWNAYHAKPELPKPMRNDDLARIATDRAGGQFIVDAPNERMAVRAERLAREFSLNIAIRGSGREYRDVREIAGGGRMILVPVDFPDAPQVDSEAAAEDVSLVDLMHWHFAPENPARLAEAEAKFCLTSDGLDDPKSLLKNIRTAVQRGLSADAALAAMTTTPAAWLGISDSAGRVRSGQPASLVITDGDLFDDKTNVLETWVDGKRFEHESVIEPKPDALLGTWTSKIRASGKTIAVTLEFTRDKKKWSGKVIGQSKRTPVKPKKSVDKESPEPESPTAKLSKIARAVDRLTAWVDLKSVNQDLPSGPSRITIVTVGDAEPLALFTTLTFASGETQTIELVPSQKAKGDETKPSEQEVEADSGENQADEKKEDEADAKNDNTVSLDEIVVNFPLGGYGVTEPIETPKAVLFRGASVWTCGDEGVLEKADILVIDGSIEAVGSSIKPPKDCTVIDVTGKHITPGLIDCHSHMGTDGGVNESGQAVTAEVRVGDFIDNTDINIYRQLAGGLTMANVLHGSANPIGGQNQVIKLRWGDGMEAMKMSAAPGGIKFALGENVKRSNSSQSPTRYPASRMGVEQLFRDRFLAAQEYDLMQQRWRDGKLEGLPPRRDLELEALAEILRGDRWIHCHSYRQDEIVALLDVLDTFGITIGTLQHILEGYKVADRMLAHGAMASAFSDWWAYKFEVYDAIPDNGAIMHDMGIVVSFNSDDRELARHLNTEAAKAMKYGGVSPEEALKFVTLNPAKQLRIDDHVGSIEVGKDADLVVWSGPPLSTLTRCEQTWVDGRPMFSLDRDSQLRERDTRWRSMLIAKILDKKFGDSKNKEEDVAEEDRWLRYDEFCHGHDHDDDNHAGHNHSGHNHAGHNRTEELQR